MVEGVVGVEVVGVVVDGGGPVVQMAPPAPMVRLADILLTEEIPEIMGVLAGVEVAGVVAGVEAMAEAMAEVTMGVTMGVAVAGTSSVECFFNLFGLHLMRLFFRCLTKA